MRKAAQPAAHFTDRRGRGSRRLEKWQPLGKNGLRCILTRLPLGGSKRAIKKDGAPSFESVRRFGLTVASPRLTLCLGSVSFPGGGGQAALMTGVRAAPSRRSSVSSLF